MHLAMESASSTRLLPELWREVFRNLNPRQLAKIRLTCREWRAIVDASPDLRKRLTIIFPSEVVLDDRYRPAFLHPAASGVVMAKARIVSVGTWWWTLGPRLTALSLNSCAFNLATLTRMLRSTPNLSILQINGDYDDSKFADVLIPRGGKVIVNFRLYKLQQLCVYRIQNVAELTGVIERMKPPLKLFAHASSGPLNDHQQKFSRFVKSVVSTLDTLMIKSSEGIIRTLSQLEGLQLKHFRTAVRETDELNEALIVEFIRAQPLIEYLEFIGIRFTNAVLCRIVTALPNLKSISVKLRPDITLPTVLEPLFLAHCPNIIEVEIDADSGFNKLAELQIPELVNCPKLEKISLASLALGDNVKQFCRRLPNLGSCTLKLCLFEDWLVFGATFMQLPLLHTISFEKVQIDGDMNDFIVTKFKHLKRLALEACDWPLEALITLICYCPELREVQLIDMPTVTDAVVLVVCQRLNLKCLRLKNCFALTGKSAYHIIMNCTKIEHVQIFGCGELQELIDNFNEDME